MLNRRAILTPLACVLVLSAAPPADRAWHLAPALSLEASVLLQEAKPIKAREGHAVQELLEESLVTFDAEGRREHRYRYIFRVDHESAVQSWGTVGTVWAPWHQERPRIRARVITPDGRVHQLDPATIGEFPVNDENPQQYDDRRRLAAPLPQLAKGALAEVEIITRETAPTFKVGSLVSLSLEQPAPVHRTRIVVEAPKTLSLRWKLEGITGVQPVLSTMGESARLTLDLGPQEPRETHEPHGDPLAHPRAMLTFTTAPSWSAVAKAYGEVVDRQIAGADLAAWAKEAIGNAADPKEKLQRLLSRLNREIRYTAIEFGEGGIVPRTPKETFTRGFGDCKDKASLLVALLRNEGITAHVALLQTGPGADVRPDLPGINHFDHAIVYVPGPTPLWIDPTAERARAGQLPFADQDRWALVATAATTGLVRTPRSASTDNREVEVREIFLAERGKARIVETLVPEGLAEFRLRNEFSHTEPKQLRENVKRYVQGAYTAEDLGELVVPDPADLGQPFQVKVEALRSETAATADLDAVVTINPWPMTARLRALIPLAAEQKAKEPLPARKGDLLIPEPHTVEWRYRIVPPQGFEPKPLPENSTLAFGPAQYSQTFEAKPDGVVTATFRFDSGKPRWSAAEVEAARAAMEAFGKSSSPQVGFDQVGEAHLAAGRVKEAIQAFRQLVAAQPTKGVPLSRLATALLRAGMGEEARALARKACELEPESMYAQRTLGWILLHDLVNRPFQKGWDYKGAQAAYRRAKALDPKDVMARRNLAVLEEHNEEGQRYAPGCHLDLAIREYQELRADLKEESLNGSLLLALGRAGRFKELEDLARTLPASQERSSALIMAVAATRGTQAALKEALTSVPDQNQRRSALVAASDALIPLRKYAEASALLTAGADGSPQAAQLRAKAAIFAQTRRHEDIPLDPKDPASSVWKLFRLVWSGHPDSKAVLGCFSTELVATLGEDKGMEDFQKGLKSGLNSLSLQGIPASVALDLTFALSQVSVEGDDAKGHRVRMQAPAGSGTQEMTWFVSREKGRFVICGMNMAASSLGTEALRRLALGDMAGAKGFLDWAREDIEPRGGDDPMASHPFCAFWTRGQEADADAVRYAAASLQAPDKDCKETLSLLRDGRVKAKDDSTRLRFDAALMVALMEREQWEELEQVSSRLLAAHPTSKRAISARGMALAALKRWEELLKFADQQLARAPKEVDFLETKAMALEGLGRHEEKEQLMLGLIKRGQGTASLYNNLAWSHLVGERVTDQTLDYTRRALLLQPENNRHIQHTLASVLAERGETTEALEIFIKSMEHEPSEDPRSEDWYLLGRIAEQFGEKEAAVKVYRRVSPPKTFESEAGSCFALAQKRLKALGQN